MLSIWWQTSTKETHNKHLQKNTMQEPICAHTQTQSNTSIFIQDNLASCGSHGGTGSSACRSLLLQLFGFTICIFCFPAPSKLSCRQTEILKSLLACRLQHLEMAVSADIRPLEQYHLIFEAVFSFLENNAHASTPFSDVSSHCYSFLL